MDEKSLIESLSHMKDFFEKNKIDYWLDTGTLLGAIREKKFIAWDYDIDIGIWQKESKKILSASKDLEKLGYEICYFPIEMCIKILRKNSEIDLNLYNINKDKATRIWHVPNFLGKKLDYLYWVLTIEKIELKRSKVSKKFTKNLQKIFSLIPNFKRKILSKIIIIIYEKIGSKTINVEVPKKFFTNLKEIKFYNIKTKVPKDTIKYLEKRYGKDWRTPKKDYIYYRDDKSVVKK